MSKWYKIEKIEANMNDDWWSLWRVLLEFKLHYTLAFDFLFHQVLHLMGYVIRRRTVKYKFFLLLPMLILLAIWYFLTRSLLRLKWTEQGWTRPQSISPWKPPPAPVEEFTYGYVGVTIQHYKHRLSCQAPAHGNLYSLPLGRVQILMLRQQIFHYPLLTFLYPLQMYHLFLLERALGTDSPDPFKCLRNIPARIWCLGIRPESGIVLRRDILFRASGHRAYCQFSLILTFL